MNIDDEVLLALAWAQPLTTDHLFRLLGSGRSRTGFWRHLDRLRRGGLIHGDLLYTYRDRVPHREGWVWVLTTKGERACADPDNPRHPKHIAPVRPFGITSALIIRDFLVAVVERARPGLSGIYFRPDTQIDREDPHARCDALVTATWSPAHAGGTTLPWFFGTGLDAERMRLWAVNVDRGGAPGLVTSLARHYQRLFQKWSAAGQPFPVPVWIIPRPERVRGVQDLWAATWPDGRWYITTAEQAPALRFLAWQDGSLVRSTLLDGWIEAADAS